MEEPVGGDRDAGRRDHGEAPEGLAPVLDQELDLPAGQATSVRAQCRPARATAPECSMRVGWPSESVVSNLQSLSLSSEVSSSGV